jgi:hypothetical protein
MQLQLDLGDGYESTEQMLTRLEGMHPAAAGQLRRELDANLTRPFNLAEYFFDYHYEAMFTTWGSRRLGLEVVQLTGSLEGRSEDEDGNLPTERLSTSLLAQPYDISSPLRTHRVLRADDEIETVRDWQNDIGDLDGVCGYLETRLADEWDLKDIASDAIFEEDAGVLYCEILLSVCAPDFYARACAIARQVQALVANPGDRQLV